MRNRNHRYKNKDRPAAAATCAALPLHWNGLVGAAAGATPAATNGLVDGAAGGKRQVTICGKKVKKKKRASM